MAGVASGFHHGDRHTGFLHPVEREGSKTLPNAAVLILRVDGDQIDLTQKPALIQLDGNKTRNAMPGRGNPDQARLCREHSVNHPPLIHSPIPM